MVVVVVVVVESPYSDIYIIVILIPIWELHIGFLVGQGFGILVLVSVLVVVVSLLITDAFTRTRN